MASPETTAAAPVLVVEDERPLAQIVADYLAKVGYGTVQVHTGPDGVTAARDLDPDLVILDLGLPGLDGVEVCREIRTFSDCYIIMVTARDDEIDKLIGLGVGADDYITKPFSPRELVARVQAALRRPRASALTNPAPADGILRFDGLSVDTAGREVTLGGSPVALTRTEFDILAALAAAPRRVLSRRQLVDAVWGENWGGDEHIVDVHVAHLRRKLDDDAGDPRFVDTVRGVGYRFIGEPTR
ncbi:response regulator transcription factor [Nocardioides pyridinolyticus]